MPLTWEQVEGDRQEDIKDIFKLVVTEGEAPYPEWLDAKEWAIIHACARACRERGGFKND